MCDSDADETWEILMTNEIMKDFNYQVIRVALTKLYYTSAWVDLKLKKIHYQNIHYYWFKNMII